MNFIFLLIGLLLVIVLFQIFRSSEILGAATKKVSKSFEDSNNRYNAILGVIFLIGLIFSSIAILFTFSASTFFFLAAINGLFIGPIQSASRVVITSMLKKNNQGIGFGLFATSGKLTSFIGPLLVGTVTFLTGSQRIGFSAAIILLLSGLIILLNIRKIS